MAGLSIKILSFRGRLCRQEERQLGRANKGGQGGQADKGGQVGHSSSIVSKESCVSKHWIVWRFDRSRPLVETEEETRGRLRRSAC